MRLILHPGHAKCGSTSIQKSIIANRNLLESNGFIIPDPQMRIRGDKGFNPNGETPRPFFRKVMEERDTSELEAKLKRISNRAKNNNKTVLISAENLVNGLAHPAGESIHKLLASYFQDVQVLYYIKPIDSFLLSAWQQWGYKNGKQFDEFVDSAVKAGNPNYKIAADTFSTIYGEDSLDVVLLDKDFLHGGNLLEDFYTRIGIDFSKTTPSESRSNISLNPHLCSILSRSPHLFENAHDETIKEHILSLVGKDSLAFKKSQGFISRDVIQKIKNRFDPDGKYLVEHYLPDASVNDLVVQPSTIDAPPLSDHEEIKQMLAIQMEFMLKLAK